MLGYSGSASDHNGPVIDMAARDSFSDWLDQFAYLDARAIAALPQSQRSLALIHRFAQASVEDGVASLFYNHPDLVGDVANAFEEFSEIEIADKIRAISGMLKPFVADDPAQWQDIIIQQCMSGTTTQEVEQLDRLVQDRWTDIYDKLENLVRSKRWFIAGRAGWECRIVLRDPPI